jgi:DNA-binding MarR family transcriptional regulator
VETRIDRLNADPADEDFGDLLQEFVNRVSHGQGKMLALFSEESVTLQQILLLRRLQQCVESTPSEVAERMHMSLPAVSQMIDRLFVLGLITRTEAPGDRRRKNLALTSKGQTLLHRVRKTRAAEYAAGTAGLSPELRKQLSRLLRKALAELPENSGAVSSAKTGRAVA